MYGSWDIKWDRQNFLGYFLDILGYFMSFYPINPENQNFLKMKKFPGDIIFHMSTINKNHVMYGSCM